MKLIDPSGRDIEVPLDSVAFWNRLQHEAELTNFELYSYCFDPATQVLEITMSHGREKRYIDLSDLITGEIQ